METKKNKRNAAIIAICLAVILVCGLVMSGIKTNGGSISVKEVTISPYGSDLSMSLYIPKEALETGEGGVFTHQGAYPAVIVNSGYTDERSCLENVANELAHRGFVVASFDMYGHGHSDTISNRGYGVVPDVFGDDMALMGAYDVLEYLRTLDFVDQTRIGMVGHSLGGAAVGSMAATSAGFYTLQDTLLNLLHDEFGVAVTLEQVAAQNADAIANETLNEKQMEQYELRKAQIEEEYSRGLRSMFVLDAGIGFANAKAVEVAGNTVWRDVQANFALSANISGGSSKGVLNKDYTRGSDATLKFISQEQPIEKDTWYQLNLSGTEERVLSTMLGEFYTSPANASIQELVSSHTLRVFVSPRGWHGYTCISGETATAAVQFFTTVLGWDNGNLTVGSDSPSATVGNTSSWKVKELASGIALIALITMILPIVGLLLASRPFESMLQKPGEPVNTKLTPVLIIMALITILLPVFTYSKGMGWAMNVSGSPLSTISVATQTSFWSFVMALITCALLFVKYFLFDKKQSNVSFAEMYGLKIKGKNVLKSIVIALIVFACIAGILAMFYGAFNCSKMKVTPLGKILYAALTLPQVYSYFLYAIYFLPFYLVNSMMVNSFRFKNMSERKNMYLVAALNGSGMLILALCQIVFGLYMRGATVFKTIPGSSATIYNIPFFAIVLFLGAIFSRKLYNKTNSSIPGALLNAAIFTFPAMQSFSYYSIF